MPTLTWTDTTPASTGSQTTGPHRWGSQVPAAPERVGRMPPHCPGHRKLPQSWPPAQPPPARDPRPSTRKDRDTGTSAGSHLRWTLFTSLLFSFQTSDVPLF